MKQTKKWLRTTKTKHIVASALEEEKKNQPKLHILVLNATGHYTEYTTCCKKQKIKDK